ncbi:hypothetical protein SO694_0006202 [Aureococcus anophagefferens]|uniref:Uncharacterized protein n=1 Tax=Aureococcus anophagefferens TaxID=44056 RepID=A0ABR1FQZ5_AURAN
MIVPSATMSLSMIKFPPWTCTPPEDTQRPPAVMLMPALEHSDASNDIKATLVDICPWEAVDTKDRFRSVSTVCIHDCFDEVYITREICGRFDGKNSSIILVTESIIMVRAEDSQVVIADLCSTIIDSSTVLYDVESTLINCEASTSCVKARKPIIGIFRPHRVNAQQGACK